MSRTGQVWVEIFKQDGKSYVMLVLGTYSSSGRSYYRLLDLHSGLQTGVIQAALDDEFDNLYVKWERLT